MLKSKKKKLRTIMIGQLLNWDGYTCQVVDINPQLMLAKIVFGTNEYGLKNGTDGWYSIEKLESSEKIKIFDR